MLGNLALAALSLMAATPPRDYAVFGDTVHWYRVHLPSHRVDSVTLPGGFHATGMAITADGTAIAFAGRRDDQYYQALYFWRLDSRAPKEIGENRGHHQDPSFSEDDQFVYFAHNPLATGPAGHHNAGGFA